MAILAMRQSINQSIRTGRTGFLLLIEERVRYNKKPAEAGLKRECKDAGSCLPCYFNIADNKKSARGGFLLEKQVVEEQELLAVGKYVALGFDHISINDKRALGLDPWFHNQANEGRA